MNLEKFGQNFGQKVKWLIFDQMSRVGSRDRHAGWGSKKEQTFYNKYEEETCPGINE